MLDISLENSGFQSKLLTFWSSSYTYSIRAEQVHLGYQQLYSSTRFN